MPNNFYEVDDIALGFAQALAATQLDPAKISEESMKLALEWVSSKEQRRALFEKFFEKPEVKTNPNQFASALRMPK